MKDQRWNEIHNLVKTQPRDMLAVAMVLIVAVFSWIMIATAMNDRSILVATIFFDVVALVVCFFYIKKQLRLYKLLKDIE